MYLSQPGILLLREKICLFNGNYRHMRLRVVLLPKDGKTYKVNDIDPLGIPVFMEGIDCPEILAFSWCSAPSVITSWGSYTNKAPHAFEKVWEKPDDSPENCTVIHPADPSASYIILGS